MPHPPARIPHSQTSSLPSPCASPRPCLPRRCPGPAPLSCSVSPAPPPYMCHPLDRVKGPMGQWLCP
eukprot:3135023-Rhodomonas_salina.1